jgi:RHS repeat-associated protein
VTSLSNGNTYTYDPNGNLTQRVVNGVTWNLSYNAENRTQSLAKADGSYGVTYLYDGDGQRVGQYSQGTATYYFAGGAYEVTGTLTGGSADSFAQTEVKKYYSIGGQMVAMDKICTVSQGCSDAGLKYFLTDHLGSLAAVTDASGGLLSQYRYLPFGQLRTDVPLPNSQSTNAQFTAFGYTGQRGLEASGLLDYKARFYDPALGRFIQPDTLIPGAGNPQAWNRYSYVVNSPVMFRDPSGHRACGDGEAIDCDGKAHNTGKIVKPVNRGKDRSGPVYNQNGVDSGYTTVPLGGVPATQPYSTANYGDIDNSCASQCSMEPEMKNGDPSGPVSLVNDILAAGLNAKAIYDDHVISVYAAYLQTPSGIQINSIYINNNNGGRPVSVLSVDFSTRERTSPPCSTGACLYKGDGAPYGVVPRPSIHHEGDYIGLGVAGPGLAPMGLTTRIPLVPSGNPYNPNNSFAWYTETTINVKLAYTDTGSAWPPISYTFEP